MKKSANKTLMVAKYNFGYGSKETYIITGIVLAMWVISTIVEFIVPGYTSDGVSAGNYFCLIIIFAPIFIVGKHYKKLINIGAKKMDFFRGCVINYIVFAVVVAIINMLFHYLVNPMLYGDRAYELLSYSTAFGWADNGIVAFFFYQLGSYILLSLIIHTFVLYQNMWIGWVADVVLAAVLSTFIPIACLRVVLISFFNTFVFNPSAFLQLIYSLILGTVIYISTLYNLARK